MYELQKKEVIIQRMLDNSPLDIDKRQGSVTWDLLSPASIEAALLYGELDRIIDLAFADTAFGTYLDRRVADLGLTRKEAAKAVGGVTFSGAAGLIIPIGTEITTGGESPVVFVTTAAGTISASGSVTVAAEERDGGAAGNVGPGAIILTLGDITGVSSVTNAAAFDGGADAESDISLLSRYLDRVQKPITSGNIWHYRDWSRQINGIADAKVYPVWNGPGTVRVVLLDEDKTAPPQPAVDEVAAYIETVRPIGANVTVQAATEVPITVTATLTLASYTTLGDVKAIFEPKLKEYLQLLAFTDPLIRYTQISKLLLDIPPILDYTDLKINGGTANIEIADGQVGTPGTVTFA